MEEDAKNTIIPGFRKSVTIGGVQCVCIWVPRFWKRRKDYWLRWDKGNWSLGIYFFSIEFFFFW